MEKHDWRSRLIEAIETSDRSMRQVSLAAKKGPGYLHSILKGGKDPTIDNLIDVCATLNISVTKILYGIEISRETEELLSLIEENPASRNGVLQILRQRDRL